MNLDQITDALRAAQARGELPTSLDTAGLRELGAGVLGRSVFSARATNAIFVSDLKKLIDQLAAGDLSEGQVRTALWETLDVLGYDAEKGGFPGEELEPALKGTLKDLKSFRRRDLIVRTQLALMQGAGEKMRGSEPDRLSTFPAWELVRIGGVEEARNWPSRWAIAGGKARPPGIDPMAWRFVGERTGFIALKGDPVWGELGSYENFDDALGVDHPPFYFNSQMGWREVSAAEVQELGITGPKGETPAEWLDGQPATLSGSQPLPSPKISLKDVDPALVERFRKATKSGTGAKPYVFGYSDLLEKDLAAADEAYRKGESTR